VPLQRPDGGTVTLLGCFHPSPHNTYTGRLTPAMLDAAFTRARDLAGVT
jgi:uracil-DNA glycosylase